MSSNSEPEILSVPVWGTADQIHACLGLGRTVLERLSREGFIRRAKMGAGKKSQVVFSGRDTQEYIESQITNGDLCEVQTVEAG